jgi:hypothetical protein
MTPTKISMRIMPFLLRSKKKRRWFLDGVLRGMSGTPGRSRVWLSGQVKYVRSSPMMRAKPDALGRSVVTAWTSGHGRHSVWVA